MKYFVVSDVHGYYSKLIKALKEKGFDESNPGHKLIICGDIMDRGSEALKMQDYILHLMQAGKVILIKGNHEDLMLDMIKDFPNIVEDKAIVFSHHYSNRTFDTAMQLTKKSHGYANTHPEEFAALCASIPFVKNIIPACLDYFETKHYIFTHGWIPTKLSYEYDPRWRHASKERWSHARWENGMLCWFKGATVPNKTVVCGHYHTSWGHHFIEKSSPELGEDADFTPFVAKGIIAIDGCTAYSGQVNCIVIED